MNTSSKLEPKLGPSRSELNDACPSLAEQRSSRATLLWIAASFAVYAVFGLAWIREPGLQFDEVTFLNAALPARMGTHTLATLSIFGRQVPSMLLSYVGALKGWIWRALFLIWKPSAGSVRIPAVLLGGLALILFYFWVRQWYSPRLALLALALAAADPTYIYTARLDWGPVVLTHVFMAAALLLGTKWYKGDGSQETGVRRQKKTSGLRRYAFLCGAGLCTGLAVWDKATFIWFLAALGVTLLLLFPQQTLHSLRPAPLAAFLLSVSVGALPLLLYNLDKPHQPTSGMIRLQHFEPGMLANKIENLRTALKGQSVYGLVSGGDDPAYSSRPGIASAILDLLAAGNGPLEKAFLWVFYGAVLLAPFLGGNRRAVLFPFLVCAFMWLQMMMTQDGGFSVHHYVLAYPLPQLGVTAVLGRIWENHNRWIQRAALAVMAMVLIGQISWDARYLRMFRETGGSWFWSDAIYDIAADIQQHRPAQLLVLDWGFSNQFLALLPDRPPGFDDYNAENVPAITSAFSQPGAVFLLHSKEFTAMPGGEKLLAQIAPQHGASCQTVQSFFQRDGRLLASLVQCRTSSAGAAVPANAPQASSR